MDFVRNFINKFTRKETKEIIDFSKKWWDSKHVMTGENLCKVRGHEYTEFTKGDTKVICKVCGKVQVLKFDGNEGP